MSEPTPNPTDPKPTENPAPTATPPSTGDKPPVTFSAEQQHVVDALLGRARTEGRATAEQAAAAKEADKEEARKRQIEIEKGNFDSVKTDLEGKLTAISGEKDALATTITAYESALAPVIKEKLDAVPDKARAGFPKDGSALNQLDWLNDPRTVALIAQTGEEARVTDARNAPRIPRTPNANGITPDAALDAERQRALATGKYAL